MTHSNLCSGGSVHGIIPSWCIPAPVPRLHTGLIFHGNTTLLGRHSPHRAAVVWVSRGDLRYQGLGFSWKTGMAVAMEAQAEGEKPGTCQEAGGEWLRDRLVELNFFLFKKK